MRCVGEAHPFAKLTDDDVRDILRAFAAGASKRQLGFDHGVTRRRVQLIIQRRAWRHVTEQETDS